MATTFRLVTTSRHAPDALLAISLELDAHVASMAASGERIVGGVQGGSIGLGERVTWSARHLGIRWRMTSEIAELEPPRRFVDRQVRGPFRRFEHEHRFEPDGHGGTRMVDVVTFQAPRIGWWLERNVLLPHLRALVLRRNAHLLAALDAREA